MPEPASEALVARLVSELLTLRPLYERHLTDHDELLPRVLFGDFTRFVEAAFAGSSRTEARADALRLVAVLEESMASGDKGAMNVISVSFLENLDQAGPEYPQIKMAMGPNLRRALAPYETR